MVWIKQSFKKIKKTWYKKALSMRYSTQSFMSSILTYGGLSLLLLYINSTGSITSKQYYYVSMWLIIFVILLLFNFLGMLLFKFRRTVKYAVIIPYISGLVFLFIPNFIFGLLAEEIEYYPIQCLVILFVSIFNFFYQLSMINYVESLKDYTTKQYVIHAPAIIFLMPAFIVMVTAGGLESPVLMGWGGLLLMSALGAFYFPQFVRIIPYWEAPKEVKSRYDNVLNKLK